MESNSGTMGHEVYCASETQHFLACYNTEMSGKLDEHTFARQRSLVRKSLGTMPPLVGGIGLYSDFWMDLHANCQMLGLWGYSTPECQMPKMVTNPLGKYLSFGLGATFDSRFSA